MRLRILSILAIGLVVAGCEGVTEPSYPQNDDEEDRDPPPDQNALIAPTPAPAAPAGLLILA